MAAIIFIVSPSSFDRVTVIRDMVFFVITCVWLALSFVDEHFTYFEAVGKDSPDKKSKLGILFCRQFSGALVMYFLYLLAVIGQHFAEKGRVVEILSSVPTINKNDSEFDPPNRPNAHLIEEFLAAINPIDLDEWHTSTIYEKISDVLKVLQINYITHLMEIELI